LFKRFKQPLAALLLAAVLFAQVLPETIAPVLAQEMALEVVLHQDATVTVGTYGGSQTETVVLAELAAAALRASGGKTGLRVILKSDEPLTQESAYQSAHEVMVILGDAGFRVALVAEDKG